MRGFFAPILFAVAVITIIAIAYYGIKMIWKIIPF